MGEYLDSVCCNCIEMQNAEKKRYVRARVVDA
jgi:hypothetical protein